MSTIAEIDMKCGARDRNRLDNEVASLPMSMSVVRSVEKELHHYAVLSRRAWCRWAIGMSQHKLGDTASYSDALWSDHRMAPGLARIGIICSEAGPHDAASMKSHVNPFGMAQALTTKSDKPASVI